MPIETIAVVGSGIMGRGIAYAAPRGGFRTILHDAPPTPPAPSRAWPRSRSSARRREKRTS